MTSSATIDAAQLSKLGPEEFTTPMLCYVVKKTGSAGTPPPPDVNQSSFAAVGEVGTSILSLLLPPGNQNQQGKCAEHTEIESDRSRRGCRSRRKNLLCWNYGNRHEHVISAEASSGTSFL
mmetsp:Transcript_2031/g.4748  ORF Transcript_2031/g.4748 Transcript_2031/m.4748 type:complete len:121 (+) Transcript_2031:88-450(+)|eukprot:CAMPEP_0178998658 /NCGR_PEP_ID=MMETSP0795-20121207/9629_1 /TAXON_ID=88552 /ORGANISM="Amoebophrya sp., Strain Ameob2" /LENGTH=120 /DNA_ID=CAMNT_0020691349 /DNA_START=24 /DNA_END=386 /DNA_ORIENTATION=+